MKYHFVFWMLLQLVLLRSATGGEKPQILNTEEAIRIAIEHNASLRAAVLDEDRADAQVTVEEGQYPFVFQADGGYTHSSTPTVISMGSVAHQQRDQVSLGAAMSKTLPFGTTTSLRMEGNRSVSSGSGFPAGTDTSRDPAYGLTTTFSVSQPLLRGFGNRVGRAGLRLAFGEKDLAKLGARRSASELARTVLVTYWELWYAALAVEIDSRARDIAKAQLDETKQRVTIGGAAPVDILAFQTRIATLEEVVLAAETERRRLAIELAMRLGIIEETNAVYPDLNEPLPIPGGIPKLDIIMAQSLAESPTIRESQAVLALAEERTVTAGEEMRQRLDVMGWFEARTLGNDEVSPVFTQYGEGGAYSGYVGLLYELPLDDRKREGERAAARIGVAIAAEQLRATEHQVRADAAKALENLSSAQKRLTLAESTYDVAKQQAEAERERYRFGAAIFTSVRDAEEAVRESELRMTRARVDLVQTQIDLDHIRGALVSRLPKMTRR